MSINPDFYKLPNIVSMIRLLMAPVLLWLASEQQTQWFLGILLLTVFTDVLDGFLARALNQITELGSHLDSWGDFIIYTVMAISAWLLWPEIVMREKLFFGAILLSFTLPVAIGLIKFRVLTGYHTWSVKFAVAITVISYILLFGGWLDWPFRIAAVACLVAGIEEIAITLIMKREHVDVRTLWHAVRINRMENKQRVEGRQ